MAGASGQATAGGITASQCRRHGINEHHGTDEGWRKFITVPGSALAASEFVPDILATDGAAREGLAASISEGRFADQVAIAAGLRQPLAILHGSGEQLVNLDYLRTLTIPALWRGEVQLIPGAGHAAHQEAPERFTALLTDFSGDLDGARLVTAPG